MSTSSSSSAQSATVLALLSFRLGRYLPGPGGLLLSSTNRAAASMAQGAGHQAKMRDEALLSDQLATSLP